MAKGELKEYLENINLGKANINNLNGLYYYLSDEAEKEKYDINDVNNLFIDYLSSELDISFIYHSILLMQDENLKNIVSGLDLQKKDINTSGDLLNYIWDNGISSGYADNDLMELLISIKTDSYKNVDLFLKYLEKHATGNLKSVIQDLDIREKKISTYTGLLKYLITQARLRDYSRESVYQLLIDLISPANFEDFLNILMQYAGSEIKVALENIDSAQFTQPLELIKFLIGHMDVYTFNETDILNLLLNIIFTEGFDVEELVKDYEKTGKKSYVRLIVPLVVVVSIILLSIVFVVIRKKQKNSKK